MLLVFETTRPFRGIEVRTETALTADGVGDARLAIASRYLGADGGPKLAASVVIAASCCACRQRTHGSGICRRCSSATHPNPHLLGSTQAPWPSQRRLGSLALRTLVGKHGIGADADRRDGAGELGARLDRPKEFRRRADGRHLGLFCLDRGLPEVSVRRDPAAKVTSASSSEVPTTYADDGPEARLGRGQQ